MLTLASYQPNFLPMGYIAARMAESCIFVLSDDVSFDRNDWVNRTKLRWETITIPTKRSQWHKETIREKQLFVEDGSCAKTLYKILNTLSKMPNIWEIWPVYNHLEAMHEKAMAKEDITLLELSLPVYKYLSEVLFKWDVELILASTLDLQWKKSERILDMCEKLRADDYICWWTAYNTYIDRKSFRDKWIVVRPQNRDGQWMEDVSIIEIIGYEGLKYTRNLLLSNQNKLQSNKKTLK